VAAPALRKRFRHAANRVQTAVEERLEVVARRHLVRPQLAVDRQNLAGQAGARQMLGQRALVRPVGAAAGAEDRHGDERLGRRRRQRVGRLLAQRFGRQHPRPS